VRRRQGSSLLTAPCRVRPPAAGLLSALCSESSVTRLRQGTSRRMAPRQGERRSTPILQQPDQAQMQTSVGSGAPSPAPAPQKLPECGGTASGGSSVRGAFSRTERSALDQAVKGSALICVLIRRGAMRREEPCRGGVPDMEPYRQRSPAEVRQLDTEPSSKRSPRAGETTRHGAVQGRGAMPRRAT
jgi:hypothetical protein